MQSGRLTANYLISSWVEWRRGRGRERTLGSESTFYAEHIIHIWAEHIFKLYIFFTTQLWRVQRESTFYAEHIYTSVERIFIVCTYFHTQPLDVQHESTFYAKQIGHINGLNTLHTRSKHPLRLYKGWTDFEPNTHFWRRQILTSSICFQIPADSVPKELWCPKLLLEEIAH